MSATRRKHGGEPVELTVACQHRTIALAFEARADVSGEAVFFAAARALVYACPACALHARGFVEDGDEFAMPGRA